MRYASDGMAPTLYHSRDMTDLAKLNPDLPDQLGAHARAIVSEPIGQFAEMWSSVPQASCVHVRGAELELRPFAPVS